MKISKKFERFNYIVIIPMITFAVSVNSVLIGFIWCHLGFLIEIEKDVLK